MALHVRILAGKLDRGAGSHVYHNELAQRLARRGHTVSVVCFKSDPDVANCANIVEVPPRLAHRAGPLWRVSSLIEYFQSSRDLRSRTLDRPDVVIGGEHLFLKAHWRRFPRTPWIYLPHSLVVTDEIKLYQMPWMLERVTISTYSHIQRWALGRATCVLRFTSRGAQVLADAYPGLAPARFVVNPVGITMPALSARCPHEPVRLLVVGQLTYRKGIDIALSALSGLTRFNWTLDIVGDGELRGALEEQSRDLGLHDRVSFRGHASDPSGWYRQSHLLLFPSRSESLGLVALEAMSHRVPCIGFRHDGRRFTNVHEEFIEHGQTGLLARDEDDFQGCLAGALEAPEHLLRMGDRGRALVEASHTWDAHLDRYEQLFAELRKGAEARPGKQRVLQPRTGVAGSIRSEHSSRLRV